MDEFQHHEVDNLITDNQGQKEQEQFNFFEFILSLITDPSKTMAKVGDNPPLWSAILIFVVVSLLSSFAGALVMKYQPAPNAQVPTLPMGTLAPALGISGFVFSLVWLFVSAGIFQILAELFGGRGKGIATLTAVALTSLPNIFSLPFSLLFVLVKTPQWLYYLIMLPIGFFIMVWRIVLYVYGIREVHQLSTGRALAVFFTPTVTLIMLLIVFTVVFIIALLPLANQLSL